MVKLLHLADVHLGGRLYAATDALLKRTRAAHRTAFRRAVGCALREEVDAVLIAGDLFEARHLDYGTEQFLTGQLARLGDAGIACFYAAGHADPGGARFRGAKIDWPASVHRFAEPSPETVALKDADGQPLAHIVGAGQEGADAENDLAAAFPEAEGGAPYVGLLHAPLAEVEKAAPPARRASATPAVPSPKAVSRKGVSPKALRQAGYAYWALGDVHRRQEADEEANAWYAGPLMGCRPPESGPQGGLLVTLVAGEAPEVTFQPFAPLCWADLVLDDLEAVRSRHALLQQAQRAFENVRNGEAEDAGWLARFTLAGGCPLAPSLRSPDARERLEQVLAEDLDLEAAFVRLRHLTPSVDPDRHRGEPHVLSEALDLIDRTAAEPALLQELAPGELAGAPASEQTEDYVRELVEALDREACACLLHETPSA